MVRLKNYGTKKNKHVALRVQGHTHQLCMYISNINMSKISSRAISIFDIQMMVKSSAIDFFFKSYQPIQICCFCM